jgi:hypothetical protein
MTDDEKAAFATQEHARQSALEPSPRTPQNLRSNIKVRASNWFRSGLLAVILSAAAFPQIPRSHPTPVAPPANPGESQPAATGPFNYDNSNDGTARPYWASDYLRRGKPR